MSKSDPTSLSVRAVVAFYREFERVTREADISLGQYRTMLYLKGGAKRAGAIAAAGAVKKPTISAMLNNLREKGWIRDEADPADGAAAGAGRRLYRPRDQSGGTVEGHRRAISRLNPSLLRLLTARGSRRYS